MPSRKPVVTASYPRCACVETIEEKLKARGEELVLAFSRNADNEIVGLPIIETQRSGLKRHSRGRTALIPNFCPFCGKQYFSGTIRLSSKKKPTKRKRG